MGNILAPAGERKLLEPMWHTIVVLRLRYYMILCSLLEGYLPTRLHGVTSQKFVNCAFAQLDFSDLGM